MSPARREQVIRNAIMRKTSKDPAWFEVVRKELLLALRKQNDFSKVVQDWIRDCERFHASSVKEAIQQMVEQINQVDDE